MKKYYFPKAYKKEIWYKITPEKKGKQMAKETIDMISVLLKRKQGDI